MDFSRRKPVLKTFVYSKNGLWRKCHGLFCYMPHIAKAGKPKDDISAFFLPGFPAFPYDKMNKKRRQENDECKLV